MGLIVLDRMEMKPRKLQEDGGVREVEMAAFVGATDNDISSLGIGLAFATGEAYFWGLVLPHALATSWRGMQVLDRLEEISIHGTIAHAYDVGSRRMQDSSLEDLELQLPEARMLREELLKTAIPDEELDRMLKICNNPANHIHVAIWELQEEIDAGTINRTEQVNLAFTLGEQSQQRRDRITAEAKHLSAQQSFVAFCRKAGVKYLCDYLFGAFGLDWGYVPMKDLDSSIALYHNGEDSSMSIICAEKKSESVKMMGQIGRPVVRLGNAQELVLESVYYDNHCMMINVHGCHGDGAKRAMTADELLKQKAHMVGITTGEASEGSDEYVTVKLPWRKRFWQKSA